MSKAKEVLTEDIYVKVEPNGSWFSRNKNEAEWKESQCKDIEEQIKRHVDDIGNTEIVRNYKYIYEEDDYTEYEGDSLEELCEEIAYQRDLIKLDNDRWNVIGWGVLEEFNHIALSLEELLYEVTNNCIYTIVGKLSDYQRTLVEIAIELNSEELNIEFKER